MKPFAQVARAHTQSPRTPRVGQKSPRGGVRESVREGSETNPLHKLEANPPSYQVSLRAEGDGPPAEVRLRRFLKTALRAFRLRCTSIAEVQQPSAGTADRRDTNAKPPQLNQH